ncbi:hypothetical protein BG004_001383 [Podila humilis]|nr:hypothetical protein BG004_001383 [Podila humilis]
MSSKTDSNAESTNGVKGDTAVIRYSQEFLMACAKSPLVERPASLPLTSVWFGEIVKEEPEYNIPPRKNNSGSKSSMSDRIVLGPPKVSFASSSLGGMRRSDDGISGFKKALDTPRETRAPRGPPSALEHGFGRDTIEKLSSHKLLPKVTPKDITGLLSGMDRRRPNDNSRSGTGLTSGTRQSSMASGSSSKFNPSLKPAGQFLSTPNPLLSSTSSSNGNGGGSSGYGRVQQRSDAPEWMNYNPDAESDTKEDEEGESNPQAFVDDIQAWKARMKEHERREKEKENGVPVRDRQDPKAPSRADSSSSWRSPNVQTGLVQEQTDSTKVALDKELLGIGKASVLSMHLANEPIQDIDMFFSPGAIDLTKPFESTSAFDKFFSAHTSSAAAMEDSTQSRPAHKADGSRFARFFAEDDADPEPAKDATIELAMPSTEQPGKQLSLDQLFSLHVPISSSAAPPPPLARMPSEAEILQSMTSARSPISPKPTENDSCSEDAFAFQKIMAALSKAPVSNPEPSTPLSSTSSQPTHSSTAEPTAKSTHGVTSTHQDPSIISIHPKPTSIGSSSPAAPGNASTTPAHISSTNGDQPTAQEITSVSTTATTAAAGGGVSAAVIASPTSSNSSDTARPAARPVQVAFGGGIPTSVYRQLSGKTDGQKSGSPLIRPLSATVSNGTSINGGGSPSLSSPSINSPRQFNAQANVPSGQSSTPLTQQQPPQQTAQQPQQAQRVSHTMQQQQPVHQQHMNKNFGPYSQGPVMQSPVMDPRLGGMYPNNIPSPVGVHTHLMENDPGFFNGVPMQRPAQDMSQFGQQMSPFSQQMHVSGPGDFMPPHPSQFVGMPPPFGGHPMHPGMFPMNPVEMLMHRGPGGPPPRPMPGMGPGPGPNHFVPNNYGHPMNTIPHQGMPMNPQFFPPQVSKPMMTREEFERRNRQQ